MSSREMVPAQENNCDLLTAAGGLDVSWNYVLIFLGASLVLLGLAGFLT
ncbi:MAG: hypothetical protein GX631_07250 [Dehalococcoidales bacterium]|jgi:hypothetical protein|nr:hypothetical protein [Dehalococcoidales bacterium]